MRTRITSSVSARRLGQVGVDACLIALAYYLAFVLRFDSGIPDRYQRHSERGPWGDRDHDGIPNAYDRYDNRYDWRR